LKFIKVQSTHAQGLVESNKNRNSPFQRLPQKYEKFIRKEVWELSENSAGVSISFFSDTTHLDIKWSVKNDNRMNHMTEAAIKGLDLYHQIGEVWHYINTGLPNGKENKQTFFNKIPKKIREFRLYLPLYDTVTNIEIGLDSESIFEVIIKKDPPIVFYGTSITQGACASRPGLAHTNIISRKLDNDCINLGFSGNGHLESSIGSIIANIDTSLIVIECIPNMETTIKIKDRIIPLILAIRDGSNNQKTPIIFIEQCIIDTDYINKMDTENIKAKNNELNRQINMAKSDGIENIFIIKQDNCINKNSEATVDTIHFNDLGFDRYASHFVKNIHALNIF